MRTHPFEVADATIPKSHVGGPGLTRPYWVVAVDDSRRNSIRIDYANEGKPLWIEPDAIEPAAQCNRCSRWFGMDPFHLGYPDIHHCRPAPEGPKHGGRWYSYREIADIGQAAKVEALRPVLALHAPIRSHPEPRFQAHCDACSTGITTFHDDGPSTHEVVWPCPTVLAIAPRTTRADMEAVLVDEIERAER